jgi:hypothetical protein
MYTETLREEEKEDKKGKAIHRTYLLFSSAAGGDTQNKQTNTALKIGTEGKTRSIENKHNGKR